VDQPTIKQEVRNAYDRYLTAFNANDLSTINATIRYPLAYIADGEVRMVDAFPYDPAELKRSKGWHTTVDAEIEVVAVSPTKAHVILRNAKRLREDGSLIETVSALYAFTKTAEGAWKIFAASAVTNPA
jgi:ketosteroid isomerase-like protein